MAKHEYLRAVLEFRNAVRALPKQAEGHYRLGLAYLAANQRAEAMSAFQTAVSLNPGHSGAQLKLAEQLVLSKDPKDAQDAQSRAQKVLLANPDDVDALFMLAAAEIPLGKPEEAERYLKLAIEKSREDLKPRFALAQLKLSLGDPGAAETILKDTVARASQSPEAAVALAVLYAKTGKEAEAEREFQRALGLDGKNAAALIGLGGLQLAAGRINEAELTYQRVASLQIPQLHAVYGRFLMQQGRIVAAVAEFERLAKLNPDDHDIRNRLVIAYVKAGRIPEAEILLTAAIKKNPRDVDALLDRSLLGLQMGKISQAQNDNDLLLKYAENSAAGHFVRALVFQARGYDTQTELGEAVRLDPTLLPARVAWAYSMIARGAGGSALKLMEDAPFSQKKLLAWVVAHNWAMLSIGRTEEARKSIVSSLATRREPNLLMQDGVLKLMTKDRLGARAVFEEAAKASPGDLRPLNLLAQSFSMQNEWEAGTEKLRPFFADKNTSGALLVYWARWLFETRKNADARSVIARLKNVDPNNREADLMLARLDIREGNTERAKQGLQLLVSTEGPPVSAFTILGALESQSGEYDAAAAHFRKALELDSSNLIALNDLAAVLSRDPDKLGEALKYAQHAVELAPGDSSVLDTLGWIFFKKGLYKDSVIALEAAAAAETRPTVEFHLGMAYTKVGKTKEGIQLMNAAVKKAPGLLKSE